MRLIISGGGTGGHVYPALAAVAELKRLAERRRDALDMCWIGSVQGMERTIVEQAGLTFESIPAKGLRGKTPIATLDGLWTLGQGYRQSLKLMQRFHPQVLFMTGGYVGVPVTLAARRVGVQIIIYLPDIEPGLAIKFLARFADKVAVTVPDTQQFFKPGLTVVTGYPVRPELFTAPGNEDGERKAVARRQLGLSDDLPVLLVFGGSQGARSINRTLTKDLETYLGVCQIIHVSGHLDEAWVQSRRAELPAKLQARYYTSAYLQDDMIAALQAADLVISRAGASVLGEFPAVGLPAVLVPYPYAGAHQMLNANYLARHQAAIVVDDADLSQVLRDMVMNLITNQEQLKAMGKASKSLAQPKAAARLAQEILGMGAHGN